MATNASSTSGLGSILPNAVGPIIGGFLALIGAFVVYYLTNKANERRFQRQLDHEDMKKALRQLHDLLESKPDDAYQWSLKITSFINSFDGTFLPAELKRATMDKMYAIQSRIEEIHPEYGLTDEDMRAVNEDQAALYGDWPPEVEAQLDIDERVINAK